MVVDTSVLLAIFFNEPHGEWAASQLQAHASEIRMSTVNLAETLAIDSDFRNVDRIVLSPPKA